MSANLAALPAKLAEVSAATAAFVVPLLVYIFTLAPDITWAHNGADGGDLITAAYTLGVPHPSGYPTYTVLGWLFSRFPFGSIGWRFNLYSAVFMAAGAWLIFKIIIVVTGSKVVALGSAWAFAFIPLVWSQGIITEVYALNVFFVGLLIWLSLRARVGKAQAGFWLGLTFGLALGVHLTVLLLTPFIGWSLSWFHRKRWQLFFSGLLPGLLIFTYLPLRANQGAITWEEPTTYAGFWALVSGQIYQGYLFDIPLTSLIPRTLAALNFFSSLGLLALILVGFGLYRGWRQARAALLWTSLSAAAYIVYAIGYRTADSFVFLLPAFVLASIGIGLGFCELLDRLEIPSAKKLAGAIFLIVPLVIAYGNLNEVSLRDDRQAQHFWQSVLAQAPRDAVLLTYEDGHTFTLWYAQHVLEQRPDLIIIDTGLLGYGWYRQDLVKRHPHLTDLAQLPDKFQQGSRYTLPLCAVLAGTQADSWQVDCL